jgi:hypothetical protein
MDINPLRQMLFATYETAVAQALCPSCQQNNKEAELKVFEINITQ